MYLTNYSPLTDLVKNFWAPALTSASAEPISRAAPLVDVVEEKDKWLFHFDVPGIDRKDIHINVDSDQLVLSGERQRETKKEDDEGYVYTERMHGKFERRFSLPDSADRDTISAKITDGVLTVTVKKSPEVHPRNIPVETS